MSELQSTSLTEVLRSFVPTFTLTNLFEIAIIAYFVYKVLVWIKNTKAWLLLRGIVFILGFTVVAIVFQMDTILWILERAATIAVTALIIIFQPELRRVLERIGSSKFMAGFFSIYKNDEQINEQTIDAICRASFDMGRARTGALMVIERQLTLKDYEITGINVDAAVSSQLLINIFEHNTPLHDGAVIIRGNRVAAATCYLPLSDSTNISKALGTRHRAALGISEVTDSVTVVVSEETGRVSIVQEGRLRRADSIEEMKNILNLLPQPEEKPGLLKRWRHRNER